MNEQEVIELMSSSTTEKEWNTNCDKVKQACSGYPSFWWATIIQSGLASKIAEKWDGSAELTITQY